MLKDSLEKCYKRFFGEMLKDFLEKCSWKEVPAGARLFIQKTKLIKNIYLPVDKDLLSTK